MATSIKYLEEKLKNKNIQAALMAIRQCEGTAAADGYNYLFGSNARNKIRFTDYSTHPNVRKIYIDKSGKPIITTAAGAYQIIYRTWVMLVRAYKLPANFEPHTQDLMAVALFDSENVLNAVAQGKFFEAEVLDGLNDQWASLPMAGYNQPEKPIALVKKYYTTAGGVLV